MEKKKEEGNSNRWKEEEKALNSIQDM